MKKVLILFVGLGFLVGLAGEAVAAVIVHPEYNAQQKAKMLQAWKAEAERIQKLDSTVREKITIPQYRVGDISFISPVWSVSVFRVVDEWNCILGVSHHTSSANYGIFIWLEDYPTEDLFTDDRVYVLGRFKVIDGGNVGGMPGKTTMKYSDSLPGFGDMENPRDMKIRVIRLLSPEELKNPAANVALEAKEKAKRAELAGDASEKDKALRKPWAIDGKREWAIFDGVRGGQVVLRFSRIHPTKRVVEETVRMYPIKALTKGDQAWVEAMMKP